MPRSLSAAAACGQVLDPRALMLDGRNTDALALQTVVAVARNEQEAAQAAADKAVASDPDSATARIAMSYARQAAFDLDGAREALETAVTLDPANALAWARLAELQLSFGKLGKALEAADMAVQADPDLARTQSVLGYAHLARVEIAEEAWYPEFGIELPSRQRASCFESRPGLGLWRPLRAGHRRDRPRARSDRLPIRGRSGGRCVDTGGSPR